MQINIIEFDATLVRHYVRRDKKMYERNVSNIEDLVQKPNEWRMKALNLIASENVLSNRAH
jgi:glycine/serine hydroxymethyltransferase